MLIEGEHVVTLANSRATCSTDRRAYRPRPQQMFGNAKLHRAPSTSSRHLQRPQVSRVAAWLSASTNAAAGGRQARDQSNSVRSPSADAARDQYSTRNSPSINHAGTSCMVASVPPASTIQPRSNATQIARRNKHPDPLFPRDRATRSAHAPHRRHRADAPSTHAYRHRLPPIATSSGASCVPNLSRAAPRCVSALNCVTVRSTPAYGTPPYARAQNRHRAVSPNRPVPQAQPRAVAAAPPSSALSRQRR